MFPDVSFELNKKQQKSILPIFNLKFNNIRFIVIQVCTYFYHDLYKFLYHMFILFSSFPVYQYITDITKFIQQVGHFTHDEYVESMKIGQKKF